jgi:hypothetical protein
MRRTNLGVVVLAALVASVVMLVAPGAAGEDESVTLVGEVVAADWDEDGNVVAIDLDTEDDTFAIDLNGIGIELMSHIGERVEVYGALIEDDGGWEYLMVHSFKVVPAEA